MGGSSPSSPRPSHNITQLLKKKKKSARLQVFKCWKSEHEDSEKQHSTSGFEGTWWEVVPTTFPLEASADSRMSLSAKILALGKVPFTHLHLGDDYPNISSLQSPLKDGVSCWVTRSG